MLKRTSILLLPLVCSLTALNARTIRGVVIASSDSTAVAGANCRLFAGDRLIGGASADEAGAFVVDTDEKSALNLEISMVGFSPTDIRVEGGTKNLNLGKIWLDEGVTLDEVTVTGNSVVNSQGRTIVYPSASDLDASSTAISLFQKLPLPGLQANPVNRSM